MKVPQLLNIQMIAISVSPLVMQPWPTPRRNLNSIEFMDLMLDKVRKPFILSLFSPSHCCCPTSYTHTFIYSGVIVLVFLKYLCHYFCLSAELFRDVQPLVQSALDGYNVSIYAYGQTNSGKTHTMVTLFSSLFLSELLLSHSYNSVCLCQHAIHRRLLYCYKGLITSKVYSKIPVWNDWYL